VNYCYKTPQTLVGNGFLTSVIRLPETEQELFSDLYLLNYLVAKFAVTIFMQHKVFKGKFNLQLPNPNENLAHKIKDHILKAAELSKRLEISAQEFVK